MFSSAPCTIDSRKWIRLHIGNLMQLEEHCAGIESVKNIHEGTYVEFRRKSLGLSLGHQDFHRLGERHYRRHELRSQEPPMLHPLWFDRMKNILMGSPGFTHALHFGGDSTSVWEPTTHTWKPGLPNLSCLFQDPSIFKCMPRRQIKASCIEYHPWN
jgi:hypothetical protein